MTSSQLQQLSRRKIRLLRHSSRTAPNIQTQRSLMTIGRPSCLTKELLTRDRHTSVAVELDLSELVPLEAEAPSIVVIWHKAWNVSDDWIFRQAGDTSEGSTLDPPAMFAWMDEFTIRPARRAGQQLKQFALQGKPRMSDRNPEASPYTLAATVQTWSARIIAACSQDPPVDRP